MTVALPAIALAFAYLFFTAPLALIVVKVHRLRSDYTRLFMLAMFLQLIPVGLVFFPLGLVGLGLLGFTLASTMLRNRKFRRLAIHNPEVHRRWTVEAIANLAAFAVGLGQKSVAVAFAGVVSKQGWHMQATWLVPATLAVWTVVGWALLTEWRVLQGLAEDT